jgi:hypothetical protein
MKVKTTRQSQRLRQYLLKYILFERGILKEIQEARRDFDPERYIYDVDDVLIAAGYRKHNGRLAVDDEFSELSEGKDTSEADS